MKTISDSTISTLATDAVISINTGWSPEKRPFDKEMHYNAILAMREGHANAISFQRTDGVKPKAHFLVVSREDKREMFFVYMHNGIGFKNVRTIVDSGCTPSRSTREGISLNGSGLVYMASVLEGELVIASKTTDDNNWHSGRCLFNRDANRVEPSHAPDIESDLESIFGTEILEEYNVIYMWKISWFEKTGAHEPWSINDSLRNSLSFMCGDDWFQQVQLNVSGTICRLHDLKYGDSLGRDVNYWLTHSHDKAKGGHKREASDHKNREVATPEEIRLRCSLQQWSVVTKPFVYKTLKTEDEVTARVTVEAYPGKRKQKRGGKDTFGFYLTLRPSTEEFFAKSGRRWSGDSQSAEGARPVFTGYLSFPLFAEAHGTEDADMTRAFSRFKDNSMATCEKIQRALEEMDIFYDADKGDANRNYVSDWHDPYAIVKVEILQLHKRTHQFSGESYETPSVNAYMDAVDRNPLFLSGLPENVINNIFKAACGAAAPVMREMHPDCYKWFADNFQQKVEPCLPLEGFGGKIGGGPKQPKYSCFDIQNVGSFDFNGELNSQSIRYLAVKDNNSGNYVVSLNTTKIPRSEGFKITPIKEGDFTFETTEIAENYKKFKEKMGIVDEVTVFKIEVSRRGLKAPGGKDSKGEWFDHPERTEAEVIDLYRGCYNSPEKDFLVPTRGFHASTEYSHVERLAVVVDVPARPSKEAPPPGPGPEGDPVSKKQKVDRTCRRDARIPVEIRKGGVVCVNLNFPLFKKALTNMPVTSATIKLGQALYDTVNLVASGIYQTAKQGTCQFEQQRKSDKWSDSAGKSIWVDDDDFVVNHSLILMLDTLPNIKEICEKLAALKHSVSEV